MSRPALAAAARCGAAVMLCLSLDGCVFLAVRAVKAVTAERGIEQVSASSDRIVLNASVNPISAANKHCGSYGKIAVQTAAEPAADRKSTVYFFDCRPGGSAVPRAP